MNPVHIKLEIKDEMEQQQHLHMRQHDSVVECKQSKHNCDNYILRNKYSVKVIGLNEFKLLDHPQTTLNRPICGQSARNRLTVVSHNMSWKRSWFTSATLFFIGEARCKTYNVKDVRRLNKIRCTRMSFFVD